MLYFWQKHVFIVIIMVWAFKENLKIKYVTHKTEGLVNRPIVYLGHIKYCHATREAYLSDRIWYGDGNSVHISIIKYAFQHWKCILSCCAQCTWIYIPSPELDQNILNVIPTVRFYVYQHIARCNVQGRQPFNGNKQCQVCEASTDAIVIANLYTSK